MCLIIWLDYGLIHYVDYILKNISLVDCVRIYTKKKKKIIEFSNEVKDTVKNLTKMVCVHIT